MRRAVACEYYFVCVGQLVRAVDDGANARGIKRRQNPFVEIERVTAG